MAERPRRIEDGKSHPQCTDGHVCQKPSGRVCIEATCDEPAGTLWGPYWCPVHDQERLERVSGQLNEIADFFDGLDKSLGHPLPGESR